MKLPLRFVQGLLIWEAFLLLPLVIIYLYSGALLRREDLGVVGTTALLGVVVTIVCYFTAPRVRGVGALVLGVALGVFFPVLGGFMLARALGGFELSGAIFSGATALALPSGVAGGIVGWLNRGQS